jgi:plasmid maintenance system antidote protein VapI
MNLIELAQGYLFKRRRAFKRVLNLQDPDVQLILADLAKFCRAHASTTSVAGDRASAVLDGRREVWLRIQHHLNLSEEELWTLYSRKE